MTVLDSSALLAMLFAEPGEDRVRGAFDDSSMTTVNLSEALSVYARRGHDAAELLADLVNSALSLIDFGIDLAALAADLEAPTRPQGLSLGDRACLALAIERDLPVLTADRTWAQLALPVRVELIR